MVYNLQCDRKVIHHGFINYIEHQVESQLNFVLLLYFFSLHQMTPLHLAVESNRIKMVECFLDKEAHINLQDDNEVILHTNAVDYFQLAGRCNVLTFNRYELA